LAKLPGLGCINVEQPDTLTMYLDGVPIDDTRNTHDGLAVFSFGNNGLNPFPRNLARKKDVARNRCKDQHGCDCAKLLAYLVCD